MSYTSESDSVHISHSVSHMIFFFVDNPRNEVGIRAETNITTPNVAATSADGEGTGVDVPNPLAVESQVVVEGSHRRTGVSLRGERGERGGERSESFV